MLLGCATFFIGKQSVSSFFLQSGPDVLTKRSVSFPSTPSPHTHCHFARLRPGPRSPAVAKARLSQEPEERSSPLWVASCQPPLAPCAWVSFPLKVREVPWVGLEGDLASRPGVQVGVDRTLMRTYVCTCSSSTCHTTGVVFICYWV